MLIVPVLRIRGGVVVTDDEGHTADCVFRDPLKTARLWRVQNARTLHVEFHDPETGLSTPENALLQTLCAAVDIPIQVALPTADVDVAESTIARGAYRVVCPEDDGPEACVRLIERLGASRVCLRLARPEERGAERAAALADLGASRLVVRCVDEAGGPDLPLARSIAGAAAERGRCHVTLAGGIGSYPDLLAATTLAPQVDSVLIRRALYRNRFPCQMIWCWHAKDAVNLDRFSTAKLSS